MKSWLHKLPELSGSFQDHYFEPKAAGLPGSCESSCMLGRLTGADTASALGLAGLSSYVS